MTTIHELATLTSKGQVTLPKAIRQLLGVNTGSKLAFELRHGEIVVTRAEATHTDPVIGAFLDMLSADMASAKHLQTLPHDLVQAMSHHLRQPIDLDQDIDIDGDVAL